MVVGPVVAGPVVGPVVVGPVVGPVDVWPVAIGPVDGPVVVGPATVEPVVVISMIRFWVCVHNILKIENRRYKNQITKNSI